MSALPAASNMLLACHYSHHNHSQTMSKVTDATETKSQSAFVLSLSLSATKKSHVKAWEESQVQTRQHWHRSWLWMPSTLKRVFAREPWYLGCWKTRFKGISAHDFAQKPRDPVASAFQIYILNLYFQSKKRKRTLWPEIVLNVCLVCCWPRFHPRHCIWCTEKSQKEVSEFT